METAKGKTRQESSDSLVSRIDAFEKYRNPHARFMAELAEGLALRLGLAESDVNAVIQAALFHDIGLAFMAPAYHSSPNPLRFDERLDLWRHPIIGEQQIAKREATRHTQLLVRWHHEWWNGSGYPDALAFEDIPIGARILRAVELYAALISDRPYRTALTPEKALEALTCSAGVECDPYVVQALLALLEEVQNRAADEELRRQQSVQPPPVSVQPQTPEKIDLPSSPLYRPEPLSNPLDLTPGPAAGPRYRSESLPNPLDLTHGPTTRPLYPSPRIFSEGLPPIEPSQEADPLELFLDDEGADHASSLKASGVSLAENDPRTSAILANALDEPLNLLGDAADPGSATPEIPRSTPAPASLPPIGLLISHAGSMRHADHPATWRAWNPSRYNKKSLLGFQASVLRQIEFRSVAIPFCGWAHLGWYLKAWNKLVLSNDPRSWASAAARAIIEGHQPLGEDQITQVLEDVYVPGTELANPSLPRWFSETDSWWMDNLRRNLDRLPEQGLRAQAIVLGLQTGDYALSFNDQTRGLRQPLTAIFWRLAGRALAGPAGHPHSRAYNEPVEGFISHSRADLMYLNLPSAHTEQAGSEARDHWRECWLEGRETDGAGDLLKLTNAPQSKQAYLAMVDKMLRTASHFKTWAIEYHEVGLAAARDITDLIQEHRPVRATYSKDLTEVAGGLHNYIIVAERA